MAASAEPAQSPPEPRTTNDAVTNNNKDSEDVQQPINTESETHGETDIGKTHNNVLEYARLASSKEQTMTLWQGLKLYPKAIAFSVIISSCIVMEGYDISLVTNFCKCLHDQ
jgi:hypothetical protein